MHDDRSAEPVGGLMSGMLEALHQPALLLDRHRRVLAVNRLFESTFDGWQPDVEYRCYTLLHDRATPCDPERVFCPLARCLDSRQAVRTVHVHKAAAGESHVNIVTRPLSEAPQEVEYALQVIEPVRIASPEPSSDRLVGRSSAFNRMLEEIEQVAKTDSPVLVAGEAGSGKGTVARKVHEVSHRSGAPFVPVDCSGLREWLFEREAFGYVRGAFAGADEAAPGLIGAAQGGTLYLHEIEDLPAGLQMKVLRLLETGLYRPEGSSRQVQADVRLIASTSVDLEEASKRDLFRADLLLRISALPVRVPPLRERRDDLPVLVESLLQRMGGSRQHRRLAPASLRALESYDFPGNIRELGTILERASILAEGDTILPEHLRLEKPRRRPSGDTTLSFSGEIVDLDQLVRRYIRWAAEQTDVTHRQLASRLGISERTLYRKLKAAPSAPYPTEEGD